MMLAITPWSEQLYGCMAVWLYVWPDGGGCVVVVRGCGRGCHQAVPVAEWLFGCVAVWLGGYVAEWLGGWVAMGLCGSL